MAVRPSSIDRLPKEVREEIGRLRQGGCTLDEILAHLRQLPIDKVSRSALGRHVQQLDVVGERMRRSRDMATALVERFGQNTDNQVQRLNFELMHGLVFETLMAAAGSEDDDGEPLTLDAKSVKFLADSLKSLASAEKTENERVFKAKAEALKEAAAAVGAMGKKMGWSADTARQVRAEILGVKLEPPK